MPDPKAQIQAILKDLPDADLEQWLAALQGAPPTQINLGQAKGYQVMVQGGTAYVGDQFHVDAATLEAVLNKLITERQHPKTSGIPNNLLLRRAFLLGGGSLVAAMGANSLLKPTRRTSITLFEVVNVNESGAIANSQTKQADEYQEDLGNGVILNMVAIPAGEFVMGSPPEEESRDDNEGPQRTVTVPNFFIGRFQVTQVQYQAIMGVNPSYFQGVSRPVESMTWDAAVAFCEKLSERTGRTYRLPSEAEWEYACRAGTTTPFHVGPTISTALANYNGNYTYGAGLKGIYREETIDVGSFPPNAFGLYDTHGNVWEWCLDHWHDTYVGAPADGSAWLSSDQRKSRLLRGGSWDREPWDCRSADRFWGSRGDGFKFVGFRVVCPSL